MAVGGAKFMLTGVNTERKSWHDGEKSAQITILPKEIEMQRRPPDYENGVQICFVLHFLFSHFYVHIMSQLLSKNWNCDYWYSHFT